MSDIIFAVLVGQWCGRRSLLVTYAGKTLRGRLHVPQVDRTVMAAVG